MNQILRSKFILLAARLIVGGILIYASVDKIVNPGEFAKAIANYHMLPFGLENTVAVLLPWIELIVGLVLIAGFYLEGASFLSFGMMMFFIFAISTAILRGYNIECGCGLKEGEMVGMGKVVEDIFYAGLSAVIYFRKIKYFEIG